MRTPKSSDWLPFAPAPDTGSLASVSGSLAKGLEHLPKVTMSDLWHKLTDGLEGPSASRIVAAGRDVAARLDRGEGAGLGNGYHHINHFKEVLYCAAALTRIAKVQGDPLTTREQAILLFSAMAHDYDHDGGKNGPVPLRLESRSIAGVQGDLDRHSVDAAASEMIGLMIATTDVSRGTDYVSALQAGRDMQPPQGYERLAVLGEPRHQRTALLAAMLRDADILPASGISGPAAVSSKRQLAVEWGLPRLDYKDHLGFLKFVVSRPDGKGGRQIGYASPAGRFFNDNIERVKHSLAQRLTVGSCPSP